MLNEARTGIVPRRAPQPGRLQRGLSVVEMMVGLAVGMIVVAGAIVMTTNQLGDHRRLTLETQIQQDLRAAGELVLRDLRRSGYWEVADRGVWAAGAAAPKPNVYTATDNASTNAVIYHYARHDDHINPKEPDSPENDALDANEEFGFKLEDGILKFKLGDAWQPLTDPNLLKVTAFRVKLNAQDISLQDYCTKPCPVGTVCNPRQQVRHADVSITGAAVHDAAVVRTVRLSSRLRNDRVVESCPS